MKTFLELLDTEQYICLWLELLPVLDNGVPDVTVVINGMNHVHQQLDKPLTLVQALPLLDPVVIEITMAGKKYSPDKETAIIIDRFEIDRFAITPDYAEYATYENDQNVDATTSYLGFNGTWTFDTKVPFYQWMHQATKQGWLLSPK